jgi:hypothetical protein
VYLECGSRSGGTKWSDQLLVAIRGVSKSVGGPGLSRARRRAGRGCHRFAAPSPLGRFAEHVTAPRTPKFASRDFHRLVALAIHLFCTLRLHTVIGVYIRETSCTPHE